LSRRDVADAYLVTGHLCGELAARAAVVADRALVSRCESLHQQMIGAASGGEPGELDALSFLFHRAINVAAGSPYMGRMVRVLTRAFPHEFHEFFPNWSAVSITEHAEILAALRAHDAERARAIAQHHIVSVGEMMLDHLDLIDYWRAERLMDEPGQVGEKVSQLRKN